MRNFRGKFTLKLTSSGGRERRGCQVSSFLRCVVEMEIEDSPKITNSKTHESQTKRTTTSRFPRGQREGPKRNSEEEGKSDRKHPSSDSSEMARRPPTTEDSPTNPSWFTPKR